MSLFSLRAHAVLARSAGFCFGVAGFLLVSPSVSPWPTYSYFPQSILSAILSAVVIVDRKPLGRPRRHRSIPTITMTRADDGDADPGLSQLGTVLCTEPRSLEKTGSRPPLCRSASSPELTTIPATSFLRPPTPERRRKRSALRKAVNQPTSA